MNKPKLKNLYLKSFHHYMDFKMKSVLKFIISYQKYLSYLIHFTECKSESQPRWSRDLSRRCVAFRLLGLWVWIPPRTWMSVDGELCVARYRSQRRADHSPRGVLPSVVCLSVIVKPRQWGGPGPLGVVAPGWGDEKSQWRRSDIR
jgi:hypothetical protein